MPEFSDSDDEGPPSEGHNSGEYKVFGCQEGFLTTQVRIAGPYLALASPASI
jgi:hypothetical protein